MMSNDKPLLVLGATSLIGQALETVASGHRLIRVTRSAQTRDGWVQADLADPDALDGLAGRGVEAALGLAPVWIVAPAIPALARIGVKRIVAFSSTSRWTKAQSPEPHERAVADLLARSEDDLIRACEAHDIAWTLLRPTLIYREGRDQNVSRLAGLISRIGFVPLAGDGEGRRQPVHAEDLAQGALAALESEAARNKAYDLPGGETLSYRQMVERIFEGMGRRPLVLAVPPVVWRLGFRLARPLLPGATAAMGSRMEADLVFDAAPAVRDFGWSPRPFRPRFDA